MAVILRYYVQHRTTVSEVATQLTGTEWQYKQVMQKLFEELRPSDFEDLIALEPIQLL